MSKSPLRLAIVGGSISGCTLANGLLKQSHIQWDLFESKESLSERGAAIAMHTNALAALKCMGIDADRILRDGKGSKRDWLRTVVAEGEHRGKEFLETIEGPWGVGRQQLLEELVKPLPKDRLHCNKKLLAITESDDGSLTLHFEDGGTFQTDAVIGCDGYRSKIRSIILGDHHPAVAPVFAGFWDARGLLPTSKAIETFGTSVINPGDTNLSACVGNGCMTLSGQISGGEMYFVTVSGIAPEGWDSTSWKTDMHREHLEKAYAGWDQKFRTGVIDCVTSSGPGVIFNQWQSQQAPTYFRGRICMMGDAAHATSNWLGQGAAMAVEDCSVLVSLFELASRPEDLETAFDAFDRVRRIGGRPAMVIEQSRLLGQILTGQKGMGPTDVQHYGIQAKRQEILSYDVRQQLKDAQETFQRLKRGG